MAYRILLAGGGTGGHVFPLMAVADALKEKAGQNGVDLELLVIGGGQFFEQAAVERGLAFKEILAGKLRRYVSPLTILDILKMPVGFCQSLWHVFRFMPDAILAKGGYASLAPALIGRLFFIPLFIHESDSVPGLTNKILGKLAKTVFVSFQSTEKYFKVGKAVLTGNPVRKEVLGGNHEEGLNFFKLKPEMKTVLILGGSQGAQTVNRIIFDSLVMLTKNFQIIHQCGAGQEQSVRTETEKIIKEGEGKYADAIRSNYRLFPFLEAEQIKSAYAACDVVISRAGAGSIFEIAAVGKPAILIPIANSSSDHQLANAREFSAFGAVVVEEDNLTPHILLNQAQSLLEDGNYKKISEKIKSCAKPDAAVQITKMMLSHIT